MLRDKRSLRQLASGLPVYQRASTVGSALGYGLIGWNWKELRVMFKHFMSDRTSMRIFIFLCINFLFMFVELVYGFYANSLGLISDAGHMLFDCTALGIGLYASFVAKLKANTVYTYGYGRYEILSGYVNGVFLLFIGYFVFVESVERLFSPPEITSDSLVVVSVLGLCVNMVGLFFFHDHGSHGHSHGGDSACAHGHSHGSDQRNHNVFAIYLHILADALGSVGVIISSILVQYKGWTSADAICSIIISILIVASVLPLLQSTLHILFQRTPVHKESVIRHSLAELCSIPGVISYREPHFWIFDQHELVGTLHVQVSETADEQTVLQHCLSTLKSHIGVQNLTVQIEKQGFLQAIDQEIKNKPILTNGQL